MALDIDAIRSIGDEFSTSLTLVDLSAPDQPLVYVNAAFTRLTGYPEAEIIGKNCRFLQGPGTYAGDANHFGSSGSSTRVTGSLFGPLSQTCSNAKALPCGWIQ